MRSDHTVEHKFAKQKLHKGNYTKIITEKFVVKNITYSPFSFLIFKSLYLLRIPSLFIWILEYSKILKKSLSNLRNCEKFILNKHGRNHLYSDQVKRDRKSVV